MKKAFLRIYLCILFECKCVLEKDEKILSRYYSVGKISYLCFKYISVIHY